MIIKTLEVDGIGPAIHAMRNPMNSWDRSDTRQGKIGQKDRELSVKLQNAGPEHMKHLRMIMVWVEITAPIFWWKEMDTYRAGVEKISCSTMHKLTSRLLMPEDFETIYNPKSHINMLSPEMIDVIGWCNTMIEAYENAEDPELKKYYWQELIHLLPQSYLQRRTVMLSYAALRNIIRQRKGHKLPQWHQLIEWAHTLPESWMLFEEEDL